MNNENNIENNDKKKENPIIYLGYFLLGLMLVALLI